MITAEKCKLSNTFSENAFLPDHDNDRTGIITLPARTWRLGLREGSYEKVSVLLDKKLIRYPHSTDPRGLCTLIRKVISGLEGFGPETMCSLKPIKEMMDTQVSRE